MSKLTVYDMQGAAVGDIGIAEELLAVDKGGQAVHDAVVGARNAARRGTASTLEKGEVAGSNRKPWRQKGTGRARAGYRQSPVWRGGGVAFGPRPRSYAVKVNKKVARLAFRRAFSEKVRAEAIRVLDDLALPEAKTRLFAAVLQSLEVARPVLVVVDNLEPNVALAARNLPGVDVVRAADVNTAQLLRFPTVMMTRAGLQTVMDRLTKAGGGAK